MAMPAAQNVSRTYSIEGQLFTAPDASPGLHLVATPIGHLDDITVRALKTLAGVDLVLCEDTRVSARLLSRYRIATIVKPYHDHNAARQRPWILERLRNGAAIALISDAGTPLVSDPGYKLVEACLADDIAVDTVPGPSATLAALTLSGLPSDRFRFCGFLPPRQQARRTQIASWRTDPVTRIAYDTGTRIAATLADIADLLPDARIALCRELTKLHQEVIRGTPEQVCEDLARRDVLKGEITLVIAPGHPASPGIDSDQVRSELTDALTRLAPAKAAGEVAKRHKLKKQDVYALAMTLRGQSDADA